jgi:hypothetical protein
MFGGNSAASTTPKLSAVQVQTMGYGVALQIIYGTNQVSPTLGWTNDFVKTEHKSGGKGIGGKGSVTYTYTASVMLFLGWGEVRGFGKVWRNKDKYDDLTKAGFGTWARGTATQAVWNFLSTNHPDEALAYRNMAYVAASKYNLGDGATLGDHKIEVYGRCLSATDTDQNHIDCHIQDVVSDFIANPLYGSIDSNTASITLDTAQMHNYCRARGLLISPILTSQKAAHEYLTEWATVANAGIVWSEGKLKFIPYADEAFSNSFGSYTPDTEIRFSFDDDSIKEPLLPHYKNPADCFNKVTIECRNRAKNYEKFVIEVDDQASIENDGLRPASTVTLDCLCLPAVAQIVAYTQLQQGLYLDTEFTIEVQCGAVESLCFDLLEPLDFIELTGSDLGINELRCRVTATKDEQDGRLTITATNAPEGVYCG